MKFDKDGTKYLDRKEIKALMNEMHISITEEWFDKTFYQFDKNKNDQIDYDEFKQMMIKISLKDEVSPIFQNFCKRAKEGLEDIEANVMTAQELQNFYLKEQNQRMDLQDEIIPLIDFYKKNNNNQEQKQTTLSFLNFCNILFCMKNEIFNKEKTKPFQAHFIKYKS